MSTVEFHGKFMHFRLISLEPFMLLVIPSIEIANGTCVRKVQRADGSLSQQDPVEMAVLWRKENAKTLHLIDRDGMKNGRPVNMETIRTMAATVDIPFEMVCDPLIVEDAQNVFDCGIYRMIVGPAVIENSMLVKRVLDAYGPSKLAAGISMNLSLSSAAALAMKAKEAGFKRIVFGDLTLDNEPSHSPFRSMAATLAEKSGLRVTISGGVSSLEDLLALQEGEPLGIDSVIVGRALYENKFACQGLWRMCEAGEFPFTARI
jgi:phosphoribosylformimino-5-aminoimidazole carboxamide ribotide isomerase